MDNQPIVQILEQRLHGLAVGILLVAAIFRLSWGYYANNSIWLNDCQITTISLVITCLLVGGCFVPLPWSYIVSYVGGGFTWLVALSLLPRSLWNQYPALRVDLPDWQVTAVGVIALASLILRLILQRRWHRELSGHGFQWMLDWAKNKPYYARWTALRALNSLGYRF